MIYITLDELTIILEALNIAGGKDINDPKFDELYDNLEERFKIINNIS